MDAIRRLHAETEKLIGMKMDLPEVGDPAILGFWVIEVNGVVVRAWYAEKCIEYCQIGASSFSAEVFRHRETIFQGAAQAGARYIHCNVPPQLDSWFGRTLFRLMLWFASKTSRIIGRYLKDAGFHPTGMINHSRRLR
jgi:hypothetical protein